MKKRISLLLALVLLLSLIPVSVSALSWSEFAVIKINPDTTEVAPYVGITHNGNEVNLSQEDYDALIAQYKAYAIRQEEKGRSASHPGVSHDYNSYGCNAKYHWLQCVCGYRANVEPHVDPLDTIDDYCFCGYHFSDNADLVTLWVKGCPPIKKFDKNTTEYKLDAYTYKDVSDIQIATRTFDSEATVEIPKDLTLKDGENKFEVKVTSENKKVTKIYTIIVNKEPRK